MASASIQEALDEIGQPPEADQRMPARRFAEQPVENDAGERGQRQPQP